ncbi:MAG: hypothetical protein LBR95_09410 [Azoarcus sp.]|nr:hypothetical protein [Azoarcus sp.]
MSKTQITNEGMAFGGRKRGSKTLVIWTPALVAIAKACDRLPSRVASMYLIRNTGGLPYTASGFKSMWQHVMNAWVEAGNERFTLHGLRAKTVTDVMESGRRASDLTGHRTEAVIARVYDRRRVRKGPATK